VDSTPSLLVWVLTLSALSVSALIVVVAAAFLWHQRQAVRQARAFGHQLLGAQEAERGRIARELHDDIVQRLWSVRLQSQSGRVETADATLETVLADLRSLAHDLHPPAIDQMNLAEALRDLAGRQLSDGQWTVSSDVPPESGLEREVAVALYRVAQEAITNVVKHAASAHVELVLQVSARQAELIVRDDGPGIAAAVDRRRAFGLRGMHERVEMLGGRLRIDSAEEAGTTVVATVPRR